MLSVICVSKMLQEKSKRTKYWLHTPEYQINKFLSPKAPIKSSPYFKLLQNPKVDYYNNVMMQFKYYLPCVSCCYDSFIRMTSPKLRTNSMSISWPFSIERGPFIVHRQEHPLKISSQHVLSVFEINGQF